MNKELFANLTELDEVKLIYETHIDKNNKKYINYTIICDVDNIVSKSSLLLCKRIVATMSVIQELFSRHNIMFSYTIKTATGFEQEFLNNKNKIAKKLAETEILYSKDNYFEDLMEECKKYTKSKRA